MTFRCVPCECGGTCDKCSGGTLRELLDAATPGPWKIHNWNEGWVHHDGDPHNVPATRVFKTIFGDDARLIALAPDLASLVLDMADALQGVVADPEAIEHPRAPSTITRGMREHMAALLARVERLGSTNEENA